MIAKKQKANLKTWTSSQESIQEASQEIQVRDLKQTVEGRRKADLGHRDEAGPWQRIPPLGTGGILQLVPQKSLL